MNIQKIQHRLLPLMGLALVISAAGCGGSSSTASNVTTGQAVLNVTWPSATARLIPAAANSITVSFLSGTTVVSTQTVARPTSGTSTSTSFSGLPVGTLTVKASAYPTTTGTGIAQATASQSVTIVADTITPVTITMGSTISTLKVTPSSPSVAINKTVAITPTAVDANGATVLTSTSGFSYSSSNTSVATVSSSGVISGIATGNSTITITETESGKSIALIVTVTPGTGDTTIGIS